MANRINDEDRFIVILCVTIGVLDTILTLATIDDIRILSNGPESDMTRLAGIAWLALLFLFFASTVVSVVVLFLSGRLPAAGAALCNLSYVRDAIDVIVFQRIEGVTVDIRSDTPVFGLASIVRMLGIQSLVRGVPSAAVFFGLALSGSIPDSESLLWAAGFAACGSAGAAIALRDHRAVELKRAEVDTERAKRSAFVHLNIHHIDQSVTFILFWVLAFFRSSEVVVRCLIPGLLVYGGTPFELWVLWALFALISTWLYYGLPSRWGRAPCDAYKRYMDRRARKRRGVYVPEAKTRFRSFKARMRKHWKTVVSFAEASLLYAFSLVFFPGFRNTAPEFWLHNEIRGEERVFLGFRTVEEAALLLALNFGYIPEQTRRDINNYPPGTVVLVAYALGAKVLGFFLTWMLSFWLSAPREVDEIDEAEEDMEEALRAAGLMHVVPLPAKLSEKPLTPVSVAVGSKAGGQAGAGGDTGGGSSSATGRADVEFASAGGQGGGGDDEAAEAPLLSSQGGAEERKDD